MAGVRGILFSDNEIHQISDRTAKLKDSRLKKDFGRMFLKRHGKFTDTGLWSKICQLNGRIQRRKIKGNQDK